MSEGADARTATSVQEWIGSGRAWDITDTALVLRLGILELVPDGTIVDRCL